MEQAVTILTYIHAFFGGIGLLTGLASILVKKGGKIHRKSGKVFSYSMVVSSLLSLVIARIPGHENTFLFLIGIFTIYMVLAGNRALTLKSKIKSKADWIDKTISGLMCLTSVTMLILGIVGMMEKIDNSILYIFFGGFGAFMTWRDFYAFRIFTEKKNIGLINHLGRMVGALIASITAFLVAGLSIGSILVWILPTVLGVVYIIYWTRVVLPGDKNNSVIEKQA